MYRALVIEDNLEVRRFLEDALRMAGFQVLTVRPCVEPIVPADCELECCSSSERPDVLVAAVISPNHCSGIDDIEKARRRWGHVKALLISATPPDCWPANMGLRFEGLPAGSYGFLSKPFTAAELNSAVLQLLQ